MMKTKENKSPTMIKYLIFAVILAIAQSSCVREPALEPKTLPTDGSIVITVSMDPSQSNNKQGVYSIGEQILLIIKIKNTGTNPLRINHFPQPLEKFNNTEALTFHLVGADGQDLLLPYAQVTKDLTSSFLNLEPKDEEIILLPLSWYLHLSDLGDYRFWVELKDEQGTVIQSNRNKFQLVEETPNISPNLLELTLSAAHPSFKYEDYLGMEVVFTNHSDESLTFLKPHDMSYYNWINPIYQFTVYDELGRVLAPPQTDVAETPPDYTDPAFHFSILPEQSNHIYMQLPRYRELSNPGVYIIKLTYIVRRNKLDFGSPTDELMDWSSDVFIGRLESNEISVTFE